MFVQKAKSALSKLLSATPLAYFPVRVRQGPARGAKWTLLPFSSNWRQGGQEDVLAGLRLMEPAVGKVCWDFGAHFGIYTLAMSRLVGASGQVVAFEPDTVASERLRYHVRINDLANVRIVAAAASDQGGQNELIVSGGLGSTLSHFRYEDEPVGPSDVVVMVLSVKPDDLVDNGEIRAPDLIKIDVQGHGAKALAGSMRSIRARSPVIIFSNHSPWEYRGARELLEPLGYSALGTSLERVDWDTVSTMDTAILVCRPIA